MILSDSTLKEFIANGEITVDPLEPDQIQPGSIDLTLGTHFLEVDSTSYSSLRLDQKITYRSIEAPVITIPAKSFLLATTHEYVKLPNNLSAFVEGRSSIGRMGLFIQNAGWVDAGFEGKITLELFNANALPIELDAGRRICQLVFCKMDKPAENPYHGKYQGQKEAVGSRIFLDYELETSTAS